MDLQTKKQNLLASLDNVRKERARIEQAHEDAANTEQRIIGAISLIDELIREAEPATEE